jgi:hypothetical protein
MAIDCVSKHTVQVYDRGGVVRMFQINDIAQVRYDRRRDDISEANIRIAARYCYQQEDDLSRLAPERHEIVITRGRERVWEGPITRLTYSATELEIHAQDVMHYPRGTAMVNAYDNAHPNTGFAIDRARLILETEMARKEGLEQLAFPSLPGYNILDHVVYHQTPSDARTARSTPAMYRTVWEEIDEMAAKGGIDYTVLGRAIHIWDTSKPLGTTRELTQADFHSDLAASFYGMDLATKAYVTDGEGNYGEAGGIDPFYGLVENVETAYDESEGADPPTSAEMASQAARNLVGRNPVPLVLRVPDNSGVNPAGTLSMSDLVPGAFMPIRMKILIRDFNQMQKLDRMAVVEDSKSEKITVVLSPATQPDELAEP